MCRPQAYQRRRPPKTPAEVGDTFVLEHSEGDEHEGPVHLSTRGLVMIGTNAEIMPGMIKHPHTHDVEVDLARIETIGQARVVVL